MGLFKAIKTIFWTSEEERELRRRTQEAIRARQDRAGDIAEARARLEKAQADVHLRVEEIRKRQDSIHDEEAPVPRPSRA